jgi:nucleotide-binding universal stress UspA family protein
VKEAQLYSKILVPLDGSDLAEAVLPHATEVARKFGASVVLLQVVDSFEKVVAEMMPATLEPTAGAGMVGVEVAEEQVRAEHEYAEGYLTETGAQLEAGGLTVERVVIEGDADDEIAKYAEENGVDLVAMSTHGRSGLGRLFYGSVAEATIKKLTCPALIIRSHEGHQRAA